MIYYGIVEKIDKDKFGVYGNYTDWIDRIDGYNPIDYVWQNIMFSFGFNKIAENIKERSREARGGLYKIYEAEKTENQNCIIFDNRYLNNVYYINEDLELFYGLFDDSLLKNNAFKKMMRSYGGSCLKIFERESLPANLKHYGGDNAIFNTGLYCSHPKDSKILIPLNDTSNLIKVLILEETISAFEALGAKKMIIKDVTSMKIKTSGGDLKLKAGFNVGYESIVLREKHFGKGGYNPERAKGKKMFIYDFPSIITTIESRINGNQIREIFTENINLSVGLDVEILSLFQANSKFDYNKVWSFEVEFYDKNELSI